ncbi:MAG: FkbM family methyltransferase [Deltaproteobacteria bacterium]|nr:MAG: FkbM family methyltransferase [Deltaproteobacteria bacterium]
MINNNLIYDFGFHNGDDTDFYLAKGFQVVAVEADPNLVKKGIERFSQQLQDGQLILLNKAVSDNDGIQNFYIHPIKKDWSSCFKEYAESDGSEAEVISVETICLATLYKLYGVPRYLKVDIEGCDLMVAQHVSQLPEKPLFISLETSKKDYAGLFAYLFVAGYVAYQLVNQGNNINRPAPGVNGEGKRIDYKFSQYSSGYFGNDLPPDKWLSYDEALTRYIKYKELKQIDNQELGLGWVDLHARHAG